MIAAVVPAAGESSRMGEPKLLLEIEGKTVIARVVAALISGGVRPVMVVLPPSDDPSSVAIEREASAAGANVYTPIERPADMRASFELGLKALEMTLGKPPETVLLAPADSPGLSKDLVTRVVEQAGKQPDKLVMPSVDGRRGHPVALPWAVARSVRDLPSGTGVNALVAADPGRVVEIAVADPGAIADLDTPEDYQKWTA